MAKKYDEIYYENKINQYMGLIIHLANRYGIEGYDREDLQQEFSMLLVKALDNYDEERGANFDTYFTTYVRQWVHKAIKKQQAEKRGTLVSIEELGISKKTKSRIDDDVFSLMIDEENLTPDELDFVVRRDEFVLNCLKEMPYGHFTIGVLIEGKTFEEVGKENGCTFQWVHQKHKQNVELLKEKLIENDYIKL